MTIEEALAAMAILDASHDGTVESAARIKRMYNVLLTSPDQFWDEFASSIDDMYLQRAEAELFGLTGHALAVPNFAELHERLRTRAMKQKGGDA